MFKLFVIEVECEEDKTTQMEPERDVDAESSTSENSQRSSSLSSNSQLTSESQMMLKGNYEKARREREIEQEKAELEKKRLQEILDLCMEFQLQEQLKSSLNSSNQHKSNLLMPPLQTSSTSSSISSTVSSSSNSTSSESIKQQQQSTSIQSSKTGNASININLNDEHLISALPKLTSVLTINQSKLASNGSNRSSQTPSSNTSGTCTTSTSNTSPLSGNNLDVINSHFLFFQTLLTLILSQCGRFFKTFKDSRQKFT